MRMCLNCAFWSKAIDVNYEDFIYMISASYFLGKVAYHAGQWVCSRFFKCVSFNSASMNEWWNQYF